MIDEYFREGLYEKIVEQYQNVPANQVTDALIVRKIAESYRKLGQWKACAVWQERLVELQPECRYMDKLKEVYLEIGASGEQWKKLMLCSEHGARETHAIASFFYRKACGSEKEELKELLRRMLELSVYRDDFYFEAAELLEDRDFYLQEIVKRSQKEENKKKAQQMLDEKTEKKTNFEVAVFRREKIERRVPEQVERYFEDVIGMQSIKEELGALYYHWELQKEHPDTIAVPFHFVISGAAGSGKTKLAHLLSDMLYRLGIAEDNSILEINAVTLLEDAEILSEEGTFVLINNAESLWKVQDEKSKEQNDGQNWLIFEELLAESCQTRERFYFFLGETAAMEDLLKNNSRLRKLVTHLQVPVYSSKELHEIGLHMIKNDGYDITESGAEQFYQEIRKRAVLGDFANGHTIYHMIVEAKKNRAYRLKQEGGNSGFTDRDFLSQEEKEETLEELLEALNSMTGLEKVKKEVEEKIAVFRENELNRKAGVGNEEPISLNTLLLGPPGTGKTTVARLLGKIYGKIGLLPRGDIFIEVTRDGLVAGYQGQTALKVDALVKKAMGGVLFIDEAYNLVTGDGDEFGKEAFNTLVTRAENYRDRLMIIMAGYEEPMRQLLNVNEGMARRFPHELHFESYSEEELIEIMQQMLEKRQYYLHVDAETAVKRLIKGRMCRSNFGNAGEIRNLLDGVIQKLSVRVFQQKIESMTERRTIRRTDVEEYTGHSEENEKTLEDYLEELNQLTGLENVKKHILDEIKSAKIAQERARRAGVAYSPGSLHMLLVGNAGTGKTTVARLIGKIYGKAGLIKNDDVFVEIRRESLVAGYMGQTGAKVIKEVERAKGGIMFIDEAYNLVNGDRDEFGKDALNTLIAPIENNRDDLMVIMAGYEAEMEELLKHNQGLRSRLNTKLVLEDYTLKQMVEIFYRKAKTEGYRIEEGLEECVEAYLAAEKERAEGDFGNARGVRNCFEAVVKRMNARLASYDDVLLTDSQLQQLSDDDICTIRRVDVEWSE